jgi:hypothetical protein
MYSSSLQESEELHTDHTQMLFSSLASCLRHCNVLPDLSASVVGIRVQFLVGFSSSHPVHLLGHFQGPDLMCENDYLWMEIMS